MLCTLSSVAARAEDVASELGLVEAQRLAVTNQPLLEAQAQAVEGARHEAKAAGQLPDPKLAFGLTDLPINGPDAYSLQGDDFTMLTVGVMQDLPRPGKRRLLEQRGEHEAAMAEEMLGATRLAIARDVALAWLDVWRPERATELLQASSREAEHQVQATEVAYTAQRAAQADVLAARVALELLRDDLAAAEEQAQDARDQLSRWIGAEAGRSLTPGLPEWRALPPLQAMLSEVQAHPHLGVEAKRVAIAQDDVALAQQAYKPDWVVEVSYEYRADFADFVSVNFTRDLPLFTARRQDRSLGAKLAEQRQAEQTSEDLVRQHDADLRRHWNNWQRLQQRVQQYDSEIVPRGEQAVAAALAAWQAGRSTLVAVLDARRMVLDLRMKRLELVTEAARRRVNLMYLSGESASALALTPASPAMEGTTP